MLVMRPHRTARIAHFTNTPQLIRSTVASASLKSDLRVPHLDTESNMKLGQSVETLERSGEICVITVMAIETHSHPYQVGRGPALPLR